MTALQSGDETLDTFSNGRLRILQKRQGYRFSVDAVLLFQFIRLKKNERVIDLGTGCGILPLLLSGEAEGCSVVGVEVQEKLAELARRNVILNGLQERISILHQDFRDLRRIFPPGVFNVVLSNPPYRRFRSGRMNPSNEKAIARHEMKGTLDDLVSIASYLLPSKGRCYLIYPASRSVDLLVILRKHHLEAKCLQFVHVRREEEARFVLCKAVKEGRPEADIMEPLILSTRNDNREMG